MPFLGFFRLKFDETIVIPEISTLKLVKMHEFVQNKKKNQIWDKKCLFWIFQCCYFQRLLSYLKLALSNQSKCKAVYINKILKFRTIMRYLFFCEFPKYFQVVFFTEHLRRLLLVLTSFLEVVPYEVSQNQLFKNFGQFFSKILYCVL